MILPIQVRSKHEVAAVLATSRGSLATLRRFGLSTTGLDSFDDLCPDAARRDKM